MEFLVEFEVRVPDGTPEAAIDERNRAEASAAAELARQGHLVRHWGEPVAPGERRTVGPYRADNDAQLDALLGRLPLHEWMHLTVTPLAPHPNDPEAANEGALPRPRLTCVYHLEASVGEPPLGDHGAVALGSLAGQAIDQGTHRRDRQREARS